MVITGMLLWMIDGRFDAEMLKFTMGITFVVRLITTAETNQAGGELYEVGLTGYKGPGAP